MYKRRDSLATLFDLKLRMVDVIIKEISACTRYPKDSVLKDKGYVLVDVEVFQDYLFYRKQLKHDSVSTLIPPFKRNHLRYLQAVD